MHHLERGRAAIDDDGVAVVAEGHSLAGDGALLGGILTFRNTERLCGQRADLLRMQSLGATTHAAQPSLYMKGCDVTPDRCLGGLRQLHQILNGRNRPLLDEAENDPMSFTFVHNSS